MATAKPLGAFLERRVLEQDCKCAGMSGDVHLYSLQLVVRPPNGTVKHALGRLAAVIASR